MAGVPPVNDPNCINVATPVIDGNHHSGEACLTCHNGAAATKFYAGGTVFSAATGGTGKPGVTVEITDAANTKVQVVSALSNAPGNFYIKTPLTGSLTVRATACPANRPMKTTGNVGDCNSCHNGTTTAVIHVP